jgi:hypothetical protein
VRTLSDKEFDIASMLIFVPEDESIPAYSPWWRGTDLADRYRAFARHGNWMPTVDWGKSGVQQILRTLRAAGFAESRETGFRGRYESRLEWRLTPDGIEAWKATVDAMCETEGVS